MFTEHCERCSVKSDVIRLFDVIYEGKASLLCERCAIIENISIIKKPEQQAINQAEQPLSVYDRMKKLSGILDQKKQITDHREERLKQLNENPYLEMPYEEPPEMIEYFHWEVMKQRRRKGLTIERLAEITRVPVEDIELLEKAKIPRNIESIRQLERFFNIRLMKNYKEVVEEHPVLLDEYGNVLDHIPEPEHFEDNEEEEKEVPIKKEPRKINITELIEMHRKKVLVSREEQKKEQSKIQERENLVEARKEELRLMKEKQSKELDTMLGGAELLNQEEKQNKIDKLFDEAFEEK